MSRNVAVHGFRSYANEHKTVMYWDGISHWIIADTLDKGNRANGRGQGNPGPAAVGQWFTWFTYDRNWKSEQLRVTDYEGASNSSPISPTQALAASFLPLLFVLKFARED